MRNVGFIRSRIRPVCGGRVYTRARGDGKKGPSPAKLSRIPVCPIATVFGQFGKRPGTGLAIFQRRCLWGDIAVKGRFPFLILTILFAIAAYGVEQDKSHRVDPGPVLRSVASPAVEQLTQDLRKMSQDLATRPFEDFEAAMEEKFGNFVGQEARDLNAAIDGFLNKRGIDNASARALIISPEEAKFLSGILLLAMRQQIATGDSRGAFSQLGERIRMKLDAAASLTPEGRALQSLAKDTASILKPSEKLKADMQTSRTRFKDSLAALRDDKIDGKGLEQFLKSIAFTGGALARELGRDAKAATKAKQLLRTLENLATLGNVANPDPVSQSLIRNYMAYELGVQRMVFDENDKVNWPATFDRLAQTGPNDARAAIGALAGAGMIGKREAEAALVAVGQTETARQVVKDVSGFLKGKGNQPSSEEILNFAPQYLASVATHMGQEGQLDPRVAERLTRGFIAADMAANTGPDAVDAARQIYENSQKKRFDWTVFDELRKQTVVSERPVRLPPVDREINVPDLLMR